MEVGLQTIFKWNIPRKIRIKWILIWMSKSLIHVNPVICFCFANSLYFLQCIRCTSDHLCSDWILMQNTTLNICKMYPISNTPQSLKHDILWTLLHSIFFLNSLFFVIQCGSLYPQWVAFLSATWNRRLLSLESVWPFVNRIVWNKAENKSLNTFSYNIKANVINLPTPKNVQ